MNLNFFDLSKYLYSFLNNTKGQKRKFLFAGFINILITNIFLQIFLFSGIVSISTSTLISQIINMFLGYMIYSKNIFFIKNIFQARFFFKYCILMIILWQLNSYGIKFLIFLDITKSLAALLFVPLLAFISFFFQRFWVFKI